jgi:hypothetical protein
MPPKLPEKEPFGTPAMLPLKKLLGAGLICAWKGCGASYRGEQPLDWRCLLVFWADDSVRTFDEIPGERWDRDAVLCPKHARLLDKYLKRIR